jgi:hypothetical protein
MKVLLSCSSFGKWLHRLLPTSPVQFSYSSSSPEAAPRPAGRPIARQDQETKHREWWSQPRIALFSTGCVFLVVLITHAACPISTSYDSIWTVPLAMSLLREGNTDLDEYRPRMEGLKYYGIVCADNSSRSAIPNHYGGCQSQQYYSHYYTHFPLGGPLLATPGVFLLDRIASQLRPRVFSARPGRDGRGFLRALHAMAADGVVGQYAKVEIYIASFYIAVTAVILFRIALQFLPIRWSMLLVTVFAYASTAWSIGSRAMWQQTASIFLLSVTLWILLRAGERPGWVQFASIPLALSYVSRPSNSIAVAVLSLYVLRYHRRHFIRFAAWALPVTVAFFAYNWTTYFRLLSPYYSMHPPIGLHLSLVALAGHLVSPSRGLLVFMPWIVFSVWGAVVSYREQWLGPLPKYLWTIVLLHFTMLVAYSAFWWGGYSYGPRLFSDLLPLFVFALIPLFKQWHTRLPRRLFAVFLMLVGFAAFVHYRGATDSRVYSWNSEPIDVDRAPWRSWDWKDPQFLRGL